MTDAEITAAAESDPDNPPLTKREMTAFKVAHLIKSVRTARNLSQREFASLYGIPIGNVRDWEQGRSIPDKAAQSYLKVIRKVPVLVAEALEHR